MQKITYYCDRCGKEIKSNRFRLEIVDINTDTTTKAFDLHPACKDAFVKLMNPPEEKEPRTRIDRGKVMALHDAGWKNKDIAGEMALKESQVSQVISQERKKREEAL